jgi:hypothetical protein
MVNVLKKMPLALCLAAFLPPLVSCSRSEPTISYGFIALVYYQDKTGPQERFSFFIIPEDDDGIENLEELYLFHDREQLRWLIKSDDWVSYTQDGKTWIGSRSIAIGEDETLPRGQYRAVLVNKGGESSERNFSFDAPEEARFPFPAIEIAEGRYTVNSAYPENRLVCYDEQGSFVSIVSLSSLSGSLVEAGVPSHTKTAALWADDPLYFTSAFTDAAAIR